MLPPLIPPPPQQSPAGSEPRAVALRALQAAGAGGAILVKGSRGMRMERIVAALGELTGESAAD